MSDARRHVHLDPLGGISGDMFLAALLDGFPELAEPCRRSIHSLLGDEARVELEHGSFGRSTFDGAVTLFSQTPARPTRAGPTIGEHTFEVMSDVLGYSEERISEMAAAGALS